MHMKAFATNVIHSSNLIEYSMLTKERRFWKSFKEFLGKKIF